MPIGVGATSSVAEQAADLGIFVIGIACWNSVACAKRHESVTIVEEQGVGAHEERANPVPCDGGESIIDVAVVACIQNSSLHSDRLGRSPCVSTLQEARRTVGIDENGDGFGLR